MRLLILFFVTSIYFSAQSQQAENIINFYNHERGGTDRLLKLNSYIMEGVLMTPEGEKPARIKMKNKVGYIFEFEVQKGPKNYLLINSNGGRKLILASGSKESIEMKRDEYIAHKSKMNILGDMEYVHGRDQILELVGEADYNGQACDLVQVRYHTVDAPNPKQLYISKAPPRLLKESIVFNTLDGEMERTTTYEDYKVTPEGYLFPMKIKNEFGEFIVKSIKINPRIEDQIFLVP